MMVGFSHSIIRLHKTKIEKTKMKIGLKDSESCIDEGFCLVSCDILPYKGGRISHDTKQEPSSMQDSESFEPIFIFVFFLFYFYTT